MITALLAERNRTLMMGVVNASPDSFSGDGTGSTWEAVRKALNAVDQGADIIDVGGESTRPGFLPVDEATECTRVLPVLNQLRTHTNHPISIDTRKPSVLRDAVAAGATMLNSVAGADRELLSTACDLRVPVVITHQQPTSGPFKSVIDNVVSVLEEGARTAIDIGIPEINIVLDPGIGFAKTPDDNIAVLSSLKMIKRLGFTTMIGTSRKSTIGKLTGKPPHDRRFGTAATVALAIAAGIDIVRVHDVAEMADVVRVSDAVVKSWRPQGWNA
jgi:dihydropteroate synthase